MTNKIHYCCDGAKLSTSDKQIFKSIGISKYSPLIRFNRIRFTGLLSKKGTRIFSVPRYYQLNNDIKDRHIIINSIIKSLIQAKESNTKKNLKFIKHTITTFPMNSFLNIYNYYRNFGLYHRSITKYRKGYNGHISWKRTMEKSNVFYSNKQFIYLPFILQIRHRTNTFISKCMNTAIIYTLHKFNFHLMYYSRMPFNKRLLDHNKRTAYLLELTSRKTFNSRTKDLLHNLINFYRKLDVRNLNIYTTYTAMVWESAVHHYLNTHLNVQKSIELNKPVFCNTFTRNSFKREPIFKINAGLLYDKGKLYDRPTLQPDHYLRTKDTQLVFDSKYYRGVENGLGLNMKQIVYHLFLRNRSKYIINSVVLPTKNNTQVFSYFNSTPIDGAPITIWESYLNINNVLNDYI